MWRPCWRWDGAGRANLEGRSSWMVFGGYWPLYRKVPWLGSLPVSAWPGTSCAGHSGRQLTWCTGGTPSIFCAALTEHTHSHYTAGPCCRGYSPGVHPSYTDWTHPMHCWAQVALSEVGWSPGHKPMQIRVVQRVWVYYQTSDCSVRALSVNSTSESSAQFAQPVWSQPLVKLNLMQTCAPLLMVSTRHPDGCNGSKWPSVCGGCQGVVDKSTYRSKLRW